ncbi:MAG: 1-deoxy-D-xylulose-5-phosphate synthase [Clostridia bacterium]|nr:1-deoxy-D-xylulose-5-phosphate synthase [Clostridia bacterium]MBR3955210.1 1-deoxy-D-xylulose-5-phosphate synthase [Clostridia bacterium]
MEKKYLPAVQSPSDLKNIPEEQLPVLAQEIRETLIETLSVNGGHLASNLGAVELTIALHRVFDSPKDSIVWDVGHQSYVHKMLTGRYDRFTTIRQPGGLSGFTRITESEHDKFNSGHSSTALSAAYGLAQANRIKKNDAYAVAVVGDGAFTGGMVYEALNNAGRSDCRLLVILNDNEMSISQNVGALARYFAVMRANPRYVKFKAGTERFLMHIPLVGKPLAKAVYNLKTNIKNMIYNSTMFEDLGFRYIGPIDGHNIEQLCTAMEAAKSMNIPVVLHINTTKGKGFEQAEKSPDIFHGISRFDPVTGEPPASGENFSSCFGSFLVQAAAKDKRVCAVTAAMAVGTGLNNFSQKYPERFFDAGIAEEHAATFCSGLAKGGMLPVFAVYSSFLQRSYDQIVHDAAMQNLKMVFAIDRAGFVGEDGMSHQGIFDAAFLNTIPDVTVYSPACYKELNNSLVNAFYHSDGVTAVRYPRGKEPVLPDDFTPSFESFDYYGDENAEVLLVTYGRIFANAANAVRKLKNEVPCAVLKLNRIKPIDAKAIEIATSKKYVLFFEEGQQHGGISETFALRLLEKGFNGLYRSVAVEDDFPIHDTVQAQLAKYRLDTDGMIKTVQEVTGCG